MRDYESGDPPEPLYCANHPTVETYLRCARCEKPICARCRVSTPVGFRCFDCANISVLPTYAISSATYLRATLAGLGGAALSGLLMGYFVNFEFWAAVLMAVLVPEAISFATNQKRGPGLVMVGLACVIAGFVISRVVMEVLNTAELQKFSYRGPEILQDLPFYFTQYSIMWLALALFFTYRRLT